MDNLPSALITLSPDHVVLYRNETTETIAPMIQPGMDIWDCLQPAVSKEKIDLMLLRGERVVFRAGPRPDAVRMAAQPRPDG